MSASAVRQSYWSKPPYFGPNDDDWNIDEGGDGKPGVSLFASALQVWSLMQDRDVPVTEAADAFNTVPDMIREAVEEHPWMLIGNDDGVEVIQHDGE